MIFNKTSHTQKRTSSSPFSNPPTVELISFFTVIFFWILLSVLHNSFMLTRIFYIVFYLFAWIKFLFVLEHRVVLFPWVFPHSSVCHFAVSLCVQHVEYLWRHGLRTFSISDCAWIIFFMRGCSVRTHQYAHFDTK